MEETSENININETEDTLTLTFTIDQVNAILSAAQELPYKIADPLIRNILEQANKQLAN